MIKHGSLCRDDMKVAMCDQLLKRGGVVQVRKPQALRQDSKMKSWIAFQGC
jgi:hypothetical protein